MGPWAKSIYLCEPLQTIASHTKTLFARFAQTILTMDFRKLNIPTLSSPNWGAYSIHLQAAAQILDCWDVIKGEAMEINPQTYDLLPQSTATMHPNAALLAAAKPTWNKKNAQALDIIHGTMSPAIWQEFTSFNTMSMLWMELETWFGKAGGAMTHLQVINMVKIQFTDWMDLLPQIQEFQGNYTQAMSNGHSRLSEDITMFRFCSSLPPSYDQTAHGYLDNVTSVANYKIQNIITHVFQEESRWKVQSIEGKTNHSTQNHWPGTRMYLYPRPARVLETCAIP